MVSSFDKFSGAVAVHTYNHYTLPIQSTKDASNWSIDQSIDQPTNQTVLQPFKLSIKCNIFKQRRCLKWTAWCRTELSCFTEPPPIGHDSAVYTYCESLNVTTILCLLQSPSVWGQLWSTPTGAASSDKNWSCSAQERWLHVNIWC